MLRLTITLSLWTIIIIIRQVSPSSKIIILFKTISSNIRKHLSLHYKDDPVLSTVIRFLFFQRLLDALINTWNSENLKSFYGPFKLIGFTSTLQLQGLPMTCNRVPNPISSPRIL